MIRSLSIKNFKNLSDLYIPEFSRINLISGKNNVGKSSLLEALRLLISDKEIFSIISDRGETIQVRSDYNAADYTTINLEAFSSLFTGRNKSINNNNRILIEGNDNALIIRFAHYVIVESKGENGDLIQKIRAVYDEDIPMEDSQLSLEIKRNNGNTMRIPLSRAINPYRFKRNDHINVNDKLIFVGTNYDNEDLTSQLWDAITLTDKEIYVIDALRIIEPGIENLAFLEAPASMGRRYPVVKVKGLNARMPLRSMGDGINHILAIILSIVNCENGCVLIDEIDNGLHYTVQKQLWSVIFSLATKLNVQIFATTHSSDCISSFSKVLNDGDNANEGRYIRLEYKANQVRATKYTPEELDIVAAQNIEIR